jgi:hypothetical protein
MQTEKLSETTAMLPTDQTSPTANNTEAQTNPETGGVTGPEPTRYGDWEKNGRCVDF